MRLLKLFVSIPFSNSFFKTYFSASIQKPAQVFDLQFRNTIGLGAGFDKNATFLKELDLLGFGFVEIGTVTPLAQSGNEKPRLFRLPEDQAIINRMGFNNDGADAVAERLKKWKNRKTDMIVGANIGKNKITPNENAWKDYEICFLKLQPLVDYVVVNISSPNTPGLRDLQQTEALRKILETLLAHNITMEKQKPLLLKISPDVDKESLDDIIELCLDLKMHGLIISNTTISRNNLVTKRKVVEKIGAGGLSGKPSQKLSTELVSYVHDKVGNKMIIIASGGIFNSEDVNEKKQAGANLFQVWTGFIYEGPAIVKKILDNLTA